jgi:sulfofructose kinase
MAMAEQGEKQFDVCGFGIAAVDDVVELDRFPAPDTKVPVLSIERHGGGQCTTALVAAARLGLKCAYAGLLGRNEHSQFTLSLLEQEGIEYQAEIRYPEAGPYYSIVLLDRSTGERTLLYSSSHVRPPAPGDIDESLIAGSRALLVDQLGPAGTLQACRHAQRWRVPVIADFEQTSDEDLREAMTLVDHLILPARVAEELTGRRDPAEAVQSMAATKRACTAVTDGRKGCWFVAGDAKVRHQPAFEVEVVDTLGCGDVFHGAYAAGIVSSMSPESAIRYAAAAAALKATRKGAQSAPDHQEVETLLTRKA